MVSSSDAQGNTTTYQYNPLNLLTQVTDARGNNTQFSYDPNGNLLSLTDALTHATTYTYNNMDRVQTRTDPLLRQESYTYDLNGNLASATDRKGQVTTFTYDPLNRLKFVGYNTVVNGGNTTYESTITYSYDAGNRMTQTVDTAGGTITRGYDNLDRLTSETTTQGVITYCYDNADRLTSVQVTGQPAVSYTYDNADRLTQINQGTSTTGFGYDIANRRTSLTLPNNVVVNYAYDNDSQLTSITYQFGVNTLGNLTYTYDSLGRRIQVGGTFARTGLPGQVTSTTYDAANELTNWNGTNPSYDANGNMLSDGSNTFTWNARNQVATLNNVALQYDTFGRRIKNVAGTSFLYNGANTIQELSGTTVTANLLSGGIDEVFTRADSSGSFAPLKDALGSAIALVDTSGNVQTSYTYDPFGNTSVTGTANGNEFQYTGRENEGNGLYFYRARYYSPLLGRFISEDPLGFTGSGPNFYAYVFDNPTNLLDPFGLSSLSRCFAEGSGLAIINPWWCAPPPPKLSGRKAFAEFVGQLLYVLGAKCLDEANCNPFGLGPHARPHMGCDPHVSCGMAVPISFPKGAKPGEVIPNVDPNSLQAGRPDLWADRLAAQRELIEQGIPRSTPIQVTTEGVIWDGNHGTAAAASAGVPVTVQVVPGTLTPHGPVTTLPVH